MEPLIHILVGKGAPRILSQLHALKVDDKADLTDIQIDLDALERISERRLMAQSKIQDGLARVMRNMSDLLDIRCVMRFMK